MLLTHNRLDSIQDGNSVPDIAWLPTDLTGPWRSPVDFKLVSIETNVEPTTLSGELAMFRRTVRLPPVEWSVTEAEREGRLP